MLVECALSIAQMSEHVHDLCARSAISAESSTELISCRACQVVRDVWDANGLPWEKVKRHDGSVTGGWKGKCRRTSIAEVLPGRMGQSTSTVAMRRVGAFPVPCGW